MENAEPLNIDISDQDAEQGIAWLRAQAVAMRSLAEYSSKSRGDLWAVRDANRRERFLMWAASLLDIELERRRTSSVPE